MTAATAVMIKTAVFVDTALPDPADSDDRAPEEASDAGESSGSRTGGMTAVSPSAGWAD